MSKLSKPSARIQEHFEDLTDPRTRKVVYPLINVVVIAICAVICGADDFVAIASFGRKKKRWFEKFLDLSDGVPSHDRFNAIFAAIKPAEFEKCLLAWISDLHEITQGQVIAIDGKTLRRSFDSASGKSAIHMVSAWATSNGISLGQTVVDAKSNEITAIPKPLEILEVTGCLVTIDAIALGADYVVVVSKATQSDSEWSKVVEELVAKHQAEVVVYGKHISQSLPALRKTFPRYACFVATSQEASRQMVADVHRLTRTLDDAPYADVFWGILTGYDAANALAIAKEREPLVIKRVASGTELAMDRVTEGVWYCELEQRFLATAQVQVNRPLLCPNVSISIPQSCKRRTNKLHSGWS